MKSSIRTIGRYQRPARAVSSHFLPEAASHVAYAPHFIASFAGRGFPGNLLRSPCRISVSGRASPRCPIHAGYRACSPPGAIIRRAPGVLQLGAAFVNSPPPCARYIPPPRMPHASLHTPFIFPSRGAGRLRLSIAAGLPLGPRQRAAPSPVATDLTSIHPSVRRIRCATRSSRNAPCCSSSACC